MAVTEITKILFRRGSGSDRSELEAFGGLAQGEPGFTVVGDAATSPITKNDSRSAFLKDQDMVEYSISQGGGDMFVGGSEGKDVYIGGASAETHWQHYFVSLRGTGFNRPFSADTGNTIESTGFIDGAFTVGRAGGATGRPNQDDWNVIFYGDGDDGNGGQKSCKNLLDPDSNGNSTVRALRWKPGDEALELWSNSAFKLPVGLKSQRPGYDTGDFEDYDAQLGMIRFSSDEETFEGCIGFDDDDEAIWGSLGGAADVVNQTYLTVIQDQPQWAVPDSGYNTTDANKSINVRGETGVIKFVVGSAVSGEGGAAGGTGDGGGAKVAGYFDNDRNLHVTNDIIAFSTSDERQKDNVQLIDNPTQKIASLDGVTFTWNDQGPSWVNDRGSREDVGLLAQQVEQVIPEAVVTRGDGYKAVDYKRVIPLLVGSIKELTARVEELESR